MPSHLPRSSMLRPTLLRPPPPPPVASPQVWRATREELPGFSLVWLQKLVVFHEMLALTALEINRNDGFSERGYTYEEDDDDYDDEEEDAFPIDLPLGTRADDRDI